MELLALAKVYYTDMWGTDFSAKPIGMDEINANRIIAVQGKTQ